VSWKDPVPDGVNDLADAADRFTAAVEIPADEDGYIG
jgi:hypothetical protein